MNFRTSTRLLVLGLVLICARKVVTVSSRRLPPKQQFNSLEAAEGSGGYERGLDLAGDFGSRSRSFDDYDDGDDDALTSGWGSGDDSYLPVPLDNVCAFPGLKSKRTGGRIQLPVSFEDLCGVTRDLEGRRRCLKAVCQCFSADRTYSVHFENHFAIECIAAGGATGGEGRNRQTAPVPVPPRGQSTSSPDSDITRFFPNYDEGEEDEEDDDDDDEYTVEIDRSRVLEEEKSRAHGSGILSKTGLLASIMGGTIIGLLCAVLLAMFIVYRVKKGRSSKFPGAAYGEKKSPLRPPLKGYTKNFDDCDYYA